MKTRFFTDPHSISATYPLFLAREASADWRICLLPGDDTVHYLATSRAPREARTFATADAAIAALEELLNARVLYLQVRLRHKTAQGSEGPLLFLELETGTQWRFRFLTGAGAQFFLVAAPDSARLMAFAPAETAVAAVEELTGGRVSWMQVYMNRARAAPAPPAD